MRAASALCELCICCCRTFCTLLRVQKHASRHSGRGTRQYALLKLIIRIQKPACMHSNMPCMLNTTKQSTHLQPWTATSVAWTVVREFLWRGLCLSGETAGPAKWGSMSTGSSLLEKKSKQGRLCSNTLVRHCNGECEA